MARFERETEEFAAAEEAALRIARPESGDLAVQRPPPLVEDEEEGEGEELDPVGVTNQYLLKALAASGAVASFAAVVSAAAAELDDDAAANDDSNRSVSDGGDAPKASDADAGGEGVAAEAVDPADVSVSVDSDGETGAAPAGGGGTTGGVLFYVK
jgi:hypothetical protein